MSGESEKGAGPEQRPGAKSPLTSGAEEIEAARRALRQWMHRTLQALVTCRADQAMALQQEVARWA